MPLRRALDAESLYETVEEYDLVVVPDDPLARAINRRLDRPHFGHFAATPRQLAAGQSAGPEDRTAFLSLIDRLDHDWEAVSHAVGNVLQCWEHEGDREAILAYDAYTDETTRAVVDALGEIETPSSRLAGHEIDPDQSVAVVGEDQLTTLERSILPPERDRIDLFADEPFELPPFHLFQSATAIVEAVLETVAADNAEHVAVVLDGASHYSALVESALEAADIPFYGGPGFVDNPHHRAFLRLLRTGLGDAETTVGELRPIFGQLGHAVPIAHDHKRLAAVEAPGVEWLTDFWAALPERTFGEALAAYAEAAETGLERFERELEELGIVDEPVTETAVDGLATYLQTYEVPLDRENEGVLLADATSSAHVDRPVVFHLGMGEGWTRAAPRRPWVDRERQVDRDVAAFERLIQSGSEQYYLVQDAAGGEPVTPCLYLGDRLEDGFERFSDHETVTHERTPRTSGEGFERAPTDVEPEPVETISQSSLNSYVNCPRDYFFDRLLEGPDQEHLVTGGLFHDFAEFVVAHPEIVAETPLAEFVDRMLAAVTPFVSEVEEPLQRRRYRIGCETIQSFLADNRPTETVFLTPTSGWGENVFAAHFDAPIDSPLTERWFEDTTLGMKGMIDLVLAPDRLLDYKSGRRKRARQIVERAAVDPPADTPNFQAALYLTYWRTVQPNERLEFTFFHFLEPLDDVITGEPDLEDALTTVTYYPFTFDEFVGSREAYEVLCDGYTDCQETFEALGYPAYGDVMDQLAFPATTDRSELRASAFASDFTTAIDAATGGDVDAEKGCDQAIRALNGVRQESFFREDLDALEGFVAERLTELEGRRAGEERFPVEGLAGEPNYRRVDNRDLLLSGDRGD